MKQNAQRMCAKILVSIKEIYVARIDAKLSVMALLLVQMQLWVVKPLRMSFKIE